MSEAESSSATGLGAGFLAGVSLVASLAASLVVLAAESADFFKESAAFLVESAIFSGVGAAGLAAGLEDFS